MSQIFFRSRSPVLFWVVIFALALVLISIFQILPPKIRVESSRIEANENEVFAIAEVVNTTRKSLRANLRFTLGQQIVRPKRRGFRPIVSQAQVCTVPAKGKATARLRFDLPLVQDNLMVSVEVASVSED
jgi:hypothetical protein